MTTTNITTNSSKNVTTKTKNKNRTHQQQWMAIRFPHFALESLGVKRDHNNILVAHKNRVCGATENLQQEGVHYGMPIATAQLLYNADSESHENGTPLSSPPPTPLRTYEREIDSEKQTLEALCHELYNYTPHIEPYSIINDAGIEEVGVLLELSRCLTLFKGLKNLSQHIEQVFEHADISFCSAFGHTKQSAWLLTYASPDSETYSIEPEYILLQLSKLPLDLIYEHPKAVEALKKSGFSYIGDVIKHIEQASLHSLGKRYGEEFIEYLVDTFDSALNYLNYSHSYSQGALFKAPTPIYQPPETFLESIQFDYPVSNCEQLVEPVNTLLAFLSKELVRKQNQTHKVCWTLYDIHHQHESRNVSFERLHGDAKFAAELTMIQFENQPLPFEIDTLELRCDTLIPVQFKHQHFYQEDNHNEQHALATLTAKLHARLGENAVYTIAPKDAHIPELSFKRMSVTENAARYVIDKKEKSHNEAPTSDQTQANPDRPSWIFNVPVAIGQRQNALHFQGKLELLQGPERIEGLWWKKPTARDYFIALREDKVRLWVFHDLYKNAWFAHGVFA